MAGYYDGNGVFIEDDMPELSPQQAAGVLGGGATVPPSLPPPAAVPPAPTTASADPLYNSPFYWENIADLTPEQAAKTLKDGEGFDNNAGIKAPGFAQVNFPGEEGYGKVGDPWDGKNISVGETNDKATAPKANPYDFKELAKYLEEQRGGDIKKGLDFGKQYFGEGNKDMAEILNTRRERAMGLNQNEMNLMRERAGAGINQQMATGMRQLRGVQAGSGVRGGAAAAQGIPIVNQANQARGAAERDIALADMQRRSQELSNYETSLTGERAGLLGTGFGFASMGAADRSGAMQYGLATDALNKWNGGSGMSEGEKPWNVKDSMEGWKKSGFDPNKSPWADWLHANVFNKEDYGVPDMTKYGPNQYLGKAFQ